MKTPKMELESNEVIRISVCEEKNEAGETVNAVFVSGPEVQKHLFPEGAGRFIMEILHRYSDLQLRTNNQAHTLPLRLLQCVLAGSLVPHEQEDGTLALLPPGFSEERFKNNLRKLNEMIHESGGAPAPCDDPECRFCKPKVLN